MTGAGPRSPAADPSPELVARFKEALDRLSPYWSDRGKLGLAVSGGPDSLAMLLLAEAAVPGQFEVATVDHGLRPNSAQECTFVAEICSARAIPCAVLKVEVEPGNLQANARTARYLALGGWADALGFPGVVTAHHADDQAETLLMRLNRGSGLAGLTGIREREWMPPFRTAFVRPLLDVRKDDLGKVVTAAGLKPVTDPSNVDERFDRARVRRFLAESGWLDALALARSARLLGEVRRDIEHIALEEWESRVVEAEDGFSYVPRCGTRSVEIEVVSAIIERMTSKVPRSEIARLIERLDVGENGSLARVLATVEGDKWVFRPEPPRRTG